MWYLLAVEIAGLFLLIRAMGWHERERRRQTELQVARVRAAVDRVER